MEQGFHSSEAVQSVVGSAAARTSAPCRVLPVDSRPLLLRALAQLIERQGSELESVGNAASYARALYLAEALQPDVVLLSICQDPLDPLDTVAALKRLCRAKVLILKSRCDVLPMARWKNTGVAGMLIAEEPKEVLLQAIIKLHRRTDPDPVRRPQVAAEREAGPLNEGSLAGLSFLTRRERALVRVMVANPGAKYVAIGAQLGIGAHTVHKYLASIYHKLNLGRRSELLVYAVRHGLDGAGDEDSSNPGRSLPLRTTGVEQGLSASAAPAAIHRGSGLPPRS